ncbi:MAG: ABC transporter ATP-binding protein [Chloroflexota bacterium]
MAEVTWVIETHDLTREFGRNRAVDSLSLSIQRGEIFGIVGPDGAGKTTLLRLLAGLLDLTGGSARVAGYDLAQQAEAIKSKIGYMAQQFSLYADLSVWENLMFFADLYGVTGKVREDRAKRLLGFAQLTAFCHRRGAHLSGGMQKKLALACTLIHQPEILLLDEPTTGVDPVSRREFWNILTELHLSGTTIVVSTPYMDEADRCSRVGLMYTGRLVMCDEPWRIRARVQGDIIELRPGNWHAACTILGALPGVLEVQTYGDLLHMFVNNAPKMLVQIKAALDQGKVTYADVRQTTPRMEEAFISLIRQLEA